MRVLILAAGRGERMRPLTDHCPKPLLRAGGRPLIEHHLLRLAAAGLRRVVINLSWQGERIKAQLGDGAAFGLQLEYSEEGEPPLETGGGIRHALPLLGGEPFAVINGDIWTDYDYACLRRPLDELAHLVLVDNPAHHPEGDFVLRHGRVDIDGSPRLTYSGIAIYSPELFARCERLRFALIEPLRVAIAAGQVSGEHHRGLWFDIGTPQRLAALDRLLHKQR